MDTACDDHSLPGLLLGRSLQDILAVAVVELVKVFQLGGLEWQIIGRECDPGPHDHDLSLKVLHHVSKEVICHGMEFFVCNLLLDGALELVAHADH